MSRPHCWSAQGPSPSCAGLFLPPQLTKLSHALWPWHELCPLPVTLFPRSSRGWILVIIAALVSVSPGLFLIALIHVPTAFTTACHCVPGGRLVAFSPRTVFLHFSSVDISGRVALCSGDCLAHCRMFGAILASLYARDVSSISTFDNQNVPGGGGATAASGG